MHSACIHFRSFTWGKALNRLTWEVSFDAVPVYKDELFHTWQSLHGDGIWLAGWLHRRRIMRSCETARRWVSMTRLQVTKIKAPAALHSPWLASCRCPTSAAPPSLPRRWGLLKTQIGATLICNWTKTVSDLRSKIINHNIRNSFENSLVCRMRERQLERGTQLLSPTLQTCIAQPRIPQWDQRFPTTWPLKQGPHKGTALRKLAWTLPMVYLP